MQGMIFPVFKGHLLSTSVGFASFVTSCEVALMGNNVALAVTVENSVAVTNLTFELQGSMDGQAWQSIVNVTQNTFGYNEVIAGAVTFPLLRVAADLSGTNASARFDVSLAMTKQ